MTPRKSANDELSKETIIEVARDLFVKDGYASASMRKIARLLHCSHGAIYYHFKNKAELIHAIIESDFKKLDQELDVVLEDSSLENDEKLFQILFRFIKFGLTHQNHYEVMFLLRDQELKGYLQQGPNNSYLKFADAIASLSPKPLLTKDIWSLFLSMHGFVTHYCRTETTFEDLKDLVTSHVHFLIKAIQ